MLSEVDKKKETLIYRSTDILDTIYNNARKDKYERDSEYSGFGSDTEFFMFYEIPKLNVYSYLFSRIPSIVNKNITTDIVSLAKPHKHILTSDEINNITNTTFASNNLSSIIIQIRIDIKTKVNEGIQDYENIPIDDNISILRFFLEKINEYDFSIFSKLHGSITGKILYVLFLCLPQTIVEKSTNRYEENNINDKIISLKEKINFINSGSDFIDKIFLFSSLIEGLLWSTTYIDAQVSEIYNLKKKSNSGHFMTVNVYDILKSIDEEPDVSLIENSFYLKLFNFYIFSKDIISKETINTFTEQNKRHFIQLGKTFFPELNKDNSSYYRELLSYNMPKSIIHGLINIFSPNEISVIDKNFKIIGQYTREDESRINITRYVNPWALYAFSNENAGSTLNLSSYKNIDSGLSFTNNSILVNTNFFTKQEHYILINYTIENNPKYDIEFFTNLRSNPFSLKEIVEKYSYISNTVNYNINSNEWYNKAFCDLYKEFDEIRFHKINHKKTRCWEVPYFRNVSNSEFYADKEPVLYDMGIGYGRFEKKILRKLSQSIKFSDQNTHPTFIPKIASFHNFNNLKIYGFDISNQLLEELKKDIPDTVVPTKICDFRNIDFIPNIIGVKPDIILFNYTSFGYFKEDSDSKSVIIKSLDILNEGGSLIIEQFNPDKPPVHVITSKAEAFPGENKKLVKTNNYYNAQEEYYTRYYGNYFYFDTEGYQEKLIKCDSYDIKLYKKIWFNDIVNVLNFNLMQDKRPYKFNIYYSDIEQASNAEYDKFMNHVFVDSSQIIIRIEKFISIINTENIEPTANIAKEEENQLLFNKKYYFINTILVSAIYSNAERKYVGAHQNKITIEDLEFIIPNGNEWTVTDPAKVVEFAKNVINNLKKNESD